MSPKPENNQRRDLPAGLRELADALAEAEHVMAEFSYAKRAEAWRLQREIEKRFGRDGESSGHVNSSR